MVARSSTAHALADRDLSLMCVNAESGYQSDGLAFLFGLLSVQWTMTDYDAVAHISFEVRRAAYAAPVALFTAVLGTRMIGWLLNVSLSPFRLACYAFHSSSPCLSSA